VNDETARENGMIDDRTLALGIGYWVLDTEKDGMDSMAWHSIIEGSR
jgi:hypothetical protein